MRYTTTQRPRLAVPGLLALFLVTAVSTPARAQVKDDAAFFSADAVTRATQTIDRIKREYGKDLRIETYPAIPSNLQDEFRRLGKEKFFEQWAQQRGQTLGLDGILVLITREPPRIQIQVGRAMREKAFTQPDREKLFNILGTKFKSKEYDDGLMDAVDFVYRTMGQNLRAAPSAANRTGSGAASGAGGASAPGSSYPPAPGGGSAGSGSGANRTSTPPGAGRAGGMACGTNVGSLMCMVIAIIGAVVLLRGVFARRSGGYGGYGPGQGPGMPPNAPYGGPGYGAGYGGAAPGGGFGRGMLGGLLGGVLGGWAFDRFGRSHDAGAAGLGGAAGAGGALPPTDPSTFDSGSTGGDFGGGGGGADFGGGGGDFGGGGGGDSGSSGGDF